MTEPAGAPGDPAAPPTIVVLTEETLAEVDAERITALHAPEEPSYRVLVPADTDRNLVADVIDHLSLLELKEAFAALRGDDDTTPAQARHDAGDRLSASVEALRERAADVTGEVTEDDPVPALAEAVARHGAREVIVVTRPHAVEDTFNRDWASRARDELGVPVLHLYGGTAHIG